MTLQMRMGSQSMLSNIQIDSYNIGTAKRWCFQTQKQWGITQKNTQEMVPISLKHHSPLQKGVFPILCSQWTRQKLSEESTTARTWTTTEQAKVNEQRVIVLTHREMNCLLMWSFMMLFLLNWLNLNLSKLSCLLLPLDFSWTESCHSWLLWIEWWLSRSYYVYHCYGKRLFPVPSMRGSSPYWRTFCTEYCYCFRW
jgi:hypothetical protein